MTPIATHRRRVVSAARAALTGAVLALALLPACRPSEPGACREYLDRYESCIARIGPQARAALQDRIAQQRQELARLAKSADGRRTVERQCAASLQAIASSCPR